MVGSFKLPATYVRPPQMALAQTVMDILKAQDNPLGVNSKILEIGYGAPGSLEIFYHLTSGSKNLRGVDIFPVPQDWKMANPEIDLLEGIVPGGFRGRDKVAKNQIEEGGPYQVIYGIDVFKEKKAFKFAEAFNPEISNVDYLKWVAHNLQENGIFVILNDFTASAIFAESEITSAGLKIKKYNEIGDLTDESTKVFKTVYGEDYGVLSLTILTK